MLTKQQTHQLHKYLKSQQKIYYKRKKMCKKMYADWEDNEYNELEHKFIWALTAKGCNTTPSFMSLNDALVTYNRITKRYEFYVDITWFDYSDRDSAQKLITYLARIQEAFAAWYIEQGYGNEQLSGYDDLGRSFTAVSIPNLRLQIESFIRGLTLVLQDIHNLTE